MLTVFNTQPLLPKGKSLCREDPIYTGSTLALIHSRGKGGGAVSGHHKASVGTTSRRVVLGEVLRHSRHPPGAGRCDRGPLGAALLPLCSLLELQLEATQTPRGTSGSSVHLPGAAEPSLQGLSVIPALTSGSSPPEHRIKHNHHRMGFYQTLAPQMCHKGRALGPYPLFQQWLKAFQTFSL